LAGASYDDANRLVTFGTRALSHDLEGNLTSDGVNTYTWNVRNQLVAVDGPAVSARFTYDPLGRRRSKEVDGRSTSFVYDGVHLIQEAGPTSTVDLVMGTGIDEYLALIEAGD